MVKKKEVSPEIVEIWEILRENARQFKEQRAAADKRQAEADKRQEVADKRQEATDKQLRKLGKQLGGEGNRWGKIVESLVAGDLTDIIRTHLQVQAHYLSTRVRPEDCSWEIDVLATNGDIAVPAEVKTTLSIDNIDRFVSRILVPFTTLIPDHQHKRIFGVIAFVKVEGNESEVVAHALKQGLIVVKAMRGMSTVLNAKDFTPRNFHP